MKIKLRSITVMLGLLAIASILVPTQTQIFGSTEGEPDTLDIREVGNNGNNAEMVKMTVKEGNQPSEREDDFELNPEDNAIFVPQGKNVEVTNDGLNFFRALVVQGDTDRQLPISQQGVITTSSLSQGFYYLDVVIQDGNTKIAYEAILFIGPRNAQNEDTVNKEINRTDKDVTITKRITNIDKTVICGNNQKFDDKTDRCVNIPPPPCKPGQTPEKDKCTPPRPPTKTPTPPPGQKPTTGTTDGKALPACTTPEGKPGKLDLGLGKCNPIDAPIPPTPKTPTPPAGSAGSAGTAGKPSCITTDGKPGMIGLTDGKPTCTAIDTAAKPPTPPTPPQGAPAGTTPGSTDLIGSPCTLPDGLPGTISGAVGDMDCKPTGVGGATTAPTGPVGSDCALPGGGTGGKIMNTNNGIACVGVPTPRDTLQPISPSPQPQPPTDTATGAGEPRPSCTTPDGQPGMMGLSEGRVTCTPITDTQRPLIAPLTPEPEEPAPTDPTELANFCVDNPTHSACETPTTPPDQTSQLTPVPEPNTQTETEDPDAALFGPSTPDTGTGTTDRLPGSTGIEGDPCPPPNEDQVYPNCPEPIPDPPTQQPFQCEDGTIIMVPGEECPEPGPPPITPSPIPAPDPCIDDPTLPECQDPVIPPKICPDGTEVPRDQPCPPLGPVEPLTAQDEEMQTCDDGSVIPVSQECPDPEELGSGGETEAGTGTEFEDFASEEQQQTDNTGDQGDPNEGGDSGEAEFESDDSGQQSDEEE
jgi:hypothetical protein